MIQFSRLQTCAELTFSSPDMHFSSVPKLSSALGQTKSALPQLEGFQVKAGVASPSLHTGFPSSVASCGRSPCGRLAPSRPGALPVSFLLMGLPC